MSKSLRLFVAVRNLPDRLDRMGRLPRAGRVVAEWGIAGCCSGRGLCLLRRWRSPPRSRHLGHRGAAAGW